MQTAAEFSRTFQNSLRSQKIVARPQDYARPISTREARRMSKVGADKVGRADPYLTSQTSFKKNAALIAEDKKLHDYQLSHVTMLATPKRRVPKFVNNTQTTSLSTRRKTFSDVLLRI